jgi:oligoendopeptidase F
MSRTETLRRSTDAAHGTRLASLTQETDRLLTLQERAEEHLASIKQMQGRISEDLSRALLPLAQAMAELTEETRQTLERVVSQSKAGHEEALESVKTVSKDVEKLLGKLDTRLRSMERAASDLSEASRSVDAKAKAAGWKAGLTAGLLSALLSGGCVLWLAWRVGALRL